MSPISPYSARVPIGAPGTTYNQRQLAGPSKYASDPRTQPQPVIDDVDIGSDFYSPMQPVWPFGPPFVNQPREWDYPVGYNLNFIPQRLEFMQMLRGMRASWGVLATIISTRQDQLLRIPWTIQRKDKPRQPSAAVDEMKKFFKKPDRKLRYSQWANKLLDDLLVLDAPTIFFARDRSGRPIAAEVLDAATIFPLIDDTGRRPDSEVEFTEDGLRYIRRQPAFQQIIKGMPLVDLDESEIMYVPMRPRPHMPMFGYPGTEQILIEASEAIRKTFYQLNFWQEGTIPDLIVTVPENWTPRQIAIFQAHMDAMLSGNLRLKSKIRFLPGGMKPFDIKNSSGESLWSQRDETLIRLAAYAYSVSPTPFVKQVNRSVAQNAQESAEQEGLYPLMAFWKDNIIDPIIQEEHGYEDVEMIFLPRPERDGEKQATIHDLQIKRGIRSRNEVRADLGFEPIDGGNVYTIELGNAIIPVEDAASGAALPLGTVGNGGPQAATDSHQTSPDGRKPAVPNPNNQPQRGQPRANQDAPVEKLLLAFLTKLSSIEVDDAAISASGDVRANSQSRLEAGNYKKGHLRLGGLNISIENPRLSHRGKKDSDGNLEWSSEMPAHYGYIRGTVGADGEQLDVFIGRRPDLIEKVWVVDQLKQTKKGKIKFDEHKCFIGYKSAKKVLRDYEKAYGSRRLFGGLTEMSLDEFKGWIKSGDLSRPLSKADTISTSTGLIGRSGRRRRRKRPQFLELHP